MKSRPILYSADELAWLKDNCTLVIGEYHRAFVEQFGREIPARNLHALRKRNGWSTGRTGRYAKGDVPLNKGKSMPFHPNSAATRFKKGNLPHNTNYLGHERVSKDGYVEISVDERNPHTGFERRYVLKHKWLWEKANGKVPRGMCLKCLSSDRLNTDPANWELVSRAMLPRLNGGRGKKKLAYDDAPAELKPTVMAIAKLEHRARNVRRGDGA